MHRPRGVSDLLRGLPGVNDERGLRRFGRGQGRDRCAGPVLAAKFLNVAELDRVLRARGDAGGLEHEKNVFRSGLGGPRSGRSRPRSSGRLRTPGPRPPRRPARHTFPRFPRIPCRAPHPAETAPPSAALPKISSPTAHPTPSCARNPLPPTRPEGAFRILRTPREGMRVSP